MKNLFKNIFLVFLLLLLISSFFSLSGTDYFEKVKEVSLSELVTQIKEGKVAEIKIKNDLLKIHLKDGTKERAFKEKDTPLTTTLKNLGVEESRILAINIKEEREGSFMIFLTNFLPIILPFLLVGLFLWLMMRQAQQGQMRAFSFGQTRARLFRPGSRKTKVSFEDVGGLEEVKSELEEIVEFLKNPKKFLEIGAKIPRGVLLMGPPGSGKTLVARAVADEAGVPFFSISGSEFVEMFVGVGASRVRSTFQLAKRSAPSILFIDELDAIGRHRGAGLGGGHDEREQTLNQILVEMDGFEKNDRVIVLAATNRPDILDPALLRPGRFDRRVTLDLPDIKDREKILLIHAKNKPLAKGVDLRKIAERTPGFSGADLENLLNEAAILAARKNHKRISQEDILVSIEKVLLGPERKSHLLSQREKEISAYHEAGHGLVAHSLPFTDPVHKISIVSRGLAAGYTLKLPVEDKHLHSRSEFLSDLAVLLGGYAAEKEVFQEITTGAADDLRKATDLARKIVTRYGMSERLGPITFGRRQELVFLGKEIHEDRNYSEKVAAEIDAEIERLIKEALKKATKIIKKRRKILDKLAKTLIKKETLEREEFEKIAGKKRKDPTKN